jgi:hypothetical protein|tara:strand:- start:58 stop:162 length:105 start_codon:yes stop_codon:yes gene_type:complete
MRGDDQEGGELRVGGVDVGGVGAAQADLVDAFGQ